MVNDAVCGMTVDPKTATEKSDYRVLTYYFCSQGCKATFDKNPGKFVQVATQRDPHSGHHH